MLKSPISSANSLISLAALARILRDSIYSYLWSPDQIEEHWRDIFDNPPSNVAVTIYGYSQDGRPLRVVSVFPDELPKNFNILNHKSWPTWDEQATFICGLDGNEHLATAAAHATYRAIMLEPNLLCGSVLHIFPDADPDGTIRNPFGADPHVSGLDRALDLVRNCYRPYGLDPYTKIETAMGLYNPGGKELLAPTNPQARALITFIRRIGTRNHLLGHNNMFGFPWLHCEAAEDCGKLLSCGAILSDFARSNRTAIASKNPDMPNAFATVPGVLPYPPMYQQSPPIPSSFGSLNSDPHLYTTFYLPELPYLLPQRLPSNAGTTIETWTGILGRLQALLAPIIDDVRCSAQPSNVDRLLTRTTKFFLNDAEVWADPQLLRKSQRLAARAESGDIGSTLEIVDSLPYHAQNLDLFEPLTGEQELSLDKLTFSVSQRLGTAAVLARMCGNAGAARRIENAYTDELCLLDRKYGFLATDHTELVRSMALLTLLCVSDRPLTRSPLQFPDGVMDEYQRLADEVLGDDQRRMELKLPSLARSFS
jgi:hypothetical protein